MSQHFCISTTLFLKYLLAFAELCNSVFAVWGSTCILRLFSVLLPEVALLTCAHSHETSAWPSPCFCSKNSRAEFVEWKPLLPGGKHPPERDVKVQNKFTRNFLLLGSNLFFFLAPKQSGRNRSVREIAYADSFCTSEVKPRDVWDFFINVRSLDLLIFACPLQCIHLPHQKYNLGRGRNTRIRTKRLKLS